MSPASDARLDGLARLNALIDRLLAALEDLGGSVGALQAAVDPLGETATSVGRLVRRFPGRSRS